MGTRPRSELSQLWRHGHAAGAAGDSGEGSRYTALGGRDQAHSPLFAMRCGDIAEVPRQSAEPSVACRYPNCGSLAIDLAGNQLVNGGMVVGEHRGIADELSDALTAEDRACTATLYQP